jgi:hypothetical protein
LLFPLKLSQEDRERLEENPVIVEQQRVNNPVLSGINLFSYYPMNVLSWNYTMGMSAQNSNRASYGVPSTQNNFFAFNNGSFISKINNLDPPNNSINTSYHQTTY